MAVESDVPSEDDKDNTDVENPAMINGTSSTVLETAGEESESEDEDVDFNPSIKGSPSEEASSSLSSEVEGLDAEVVNSCGEVAVLASEGLSDHVGCMVDEPKEDGVVGVSCERELENGAVDGKKDGSSSGIEAVENASEPRIDMSESRTETIADCGEEDAICKRTRARYSLASFTLDELENFLQESDDDDDLQNVDEEEEYRKFLAAVLKGSDEDHQGNVEDNDDDDEDNDADFEIEIEEALESDNDDCIVTAHNDKEFERSSRRPKTRQNRRQKASALGKKKGVKREERPLRPLVPIMFGARAPSVPCLGDKFVTNSSHMQDLPVKGFGDHQIGQLHRLIYEHVQLLIQIYSLCVLEPSRQPIAAQVKGLLSELIHKRDLVLAWRTVAYPTSCFVPQYVNSRPLQIQSCVPCSSVASDGIDAQGCRWLPSIGGPVISVLDVEPLTLVGKYIDDVSNVVREHQRRYVESSNIYLEKQPLFPHPICPSPEANHSVIRGDDPSPDACAVSPNDKVPKKTMAGTLVESTKKQSVALVPQQIAKLAQPFYQLFNPALFPHKPPSPAVANRVLFTDAEDVLLAMGIMEYNNDWKAIQQRFLTCKSEHQIFVRAKNRSSSKAPDNPIKTVRKLKTSPLTDDEKARIGEGLQTFRLDWASVWRAIVPYRDPNLLPRQWRIAVGTQKSYKISAERQEKRRVYESNRRSKVAAVDNSLSRAEKIMKSNQSELCGMRNRTGEGGMDNGKEAYVHEAFLADWRPINTGLNATKNISSSLNSRCLPGDVASGRFCELREVPNNHGNEESQSKRDRAQNVLARSEDSHLMNHKSSHAYRGFGYPSSLSTSNAEAFGCDSLLHSQKAQKPGFSNLVKLAPELPPVKLPPAVRVISQASLRSSQLVNSTEVRASDRGLQNPFSEAIAINSASKLAKPVSDKTRVSNSNSASLYSQKGAIVNNRSLMKDTGTDLDPQMHPLLFRSLEEGHVPNYSVNSSSRVPTFSFFPALQHQISVNLLQNSHPAGPPGCSNSSCSKEITSTLSSLNFHPLLQRTSGFSAKSIGTDSTGSLVTTDLELSRDGYVEELIYRAGADAAQLVATSKPTSPSTGVIDLNLGIHLSSPSRKRKTSSHEGAETIPMVPSISAGESIECANGRTNLHGQLSQHAAHHLSDPMPAEDLGKSGFGSFAAHLDKLDAGSSLCIKDNVGAQPLLEIVMEQEELSDSDEEMEDVEFECEEMTDSDGEEGPTAEQIGNTKHKDQENTSLSADNNDQRSESATPEISKVNKAQRKGKSPRADLKRLGKGSTKGSWLSLNSHDSHHSAQAGPRCSEKSPGVAPITSTSTRNSRKATMSRKNSVGEQTIVSPVLDTLPSSSRKHRKSVSKPQSTSRTHITVVNPSCTEKDGKV